MVSCTQRMPAGLPFGIPGMGELIEGAMQQAPHLARQGNDVESGDIEFGLVIAALCMGQLDSDLGSPARSQPSDRVGSIAFGHQLRQIQ
jgi:hypothetical protein